MIALQRTLSNTAVALSALLAFGCSASSEDSNDVREWARGSEAPLATSGDLSVLVGAAPAPPLETGPMAVYLVIANEGSLPDTLIAATSMTAARGSVHATRNANGMSGMGPAGPLAIEPGGLLRMAPGGIHVMLDDLMVPLAAGDSITVRLEFSRTDPIDVALPVVTYADIRAQLGPFASDPD